MDGLWDPMAQLVTFLGVLRDAQAGTNPLDNDQTTAMIACEPLIGGSHEEAKMLAIAAIGVLFAVLRDTDQLHMIEKIALSIAMDRP